VEEDNDRPRTFHRYIAEDFNAPAKLDILKLYQPTYESGMTKAHQMLTELGIDEDLSHFLLQRVLHLDAAERPDAREALAELQEILQCDEYPAMWAMHQRPARPRIETS
jgi:hypothetical protein